MANWSIDWGTRNDLIMVGEVVVGNSNGSGSHHSVNEAIGTVGEGVVINPDVARSKNGNGITISHGSPPIMGRRAPDHGVPSGLAIVDIKAMDDHIGDILDGDASPIGNMDIHSASINCLETVHDKLFFQFDHHVPLEHDPQWPVLDDGMAESAGSGIDGVVVTRVCHHIVPSITATNGIAPKPNAAVSKALAISVPIWVTAPAVINGIPSSTREITQLSPFRTVADAPGHFESTSIIMVLIDIFMTNSFLKHMNECIQNIEWEQGILLPSFHRYRVKTVVLNNYEGAM